MLKPHQRLEESQKQISIVDEQIEEVDQRERLTEVYYELEQLIQELDPEVEVVKND